MSEPLIGLAPGFRARCTRILDGVARAGLRVRWTSGLRSWEAQAALWAKGRDAHGQIVAPREVVTFAAPGYSWHNFGLAADAALLRPDGRAEWSGAADLDGDGIRDWLEYGQCAEAEGCEWGGRWTKLVDLPHVQAPGGLTLARARSLWHDGGLEAVWWAAGLAA